MEKVVFTLLALIAGLTASAQTPSSTSRRVQFYAEPSAVLALPGDFAVAGGGALAFGVTFKTAHSVEAQVIYFESTDRGLDVNFMPLLLSYKYSFPLSSKLAAKVGGSAGVTMEEGHYWRITSNQTAFTVGATAGLSYSLTPRTSVEGTAMALHLDKTRFTTSGNIVLLTLGLKIRF